MIKKNRLDFYRNFFVVSAILLCCQVAAAQQEFTVEGIALGMPRHAAAEMVAGTTCYAHVKNGQVDTEICELPPPGQRDPLFAGTTAKRAVHISEGRVSSFSVLMSESDAVKVTAMLVNQLGQFIPRESQRAKRAGKQGLVLVWDKPTQRVVIDMHPTDTQEVVLVALPKR